MTTKPPPADPSQAPEPGARGAWPRRVKRSLAFRSGPLYRRLLALLPAPKASGKPRLGVPLITMCGDKHLPMLIEMLYSVSVRWSLMPDVTVVNDGSLEPATLARRLAWWPGTLQITHWQDDREYHRARGRKALVRYADDAPFGKKLSTVLAASERQRTFWCDCDILFFDDFTRWLVASAPRPPFVLGAEDWVYAYDERLFPFGLSYLNGRPPVNAGVSLFEGNLYEEGGLEPLIQQAAADGNWFTEQTIMAHAVYRMGRIEWTRDILRLFDDDRFTLLPTYFRQRWTARHYTNNIRHLFWRDALALRLGLGWVASTRTA